jgi:hypothetical protein
MANIRKGPQTGVLQRRSWVYRGGAMQDPANEHPRIPLPRTGVKIALGRLHFHGFGVARQGPWITWVNKQNAFLLCYTARKFEERGNTNDSRQGDARHISGHRSHHGR